MPATENTHTHTKCWSPACYRRLHTHAQHVHTLQDSSTQGAPRGGRQTIAPLSCAVPPSRTEDTALKPHHLLHLLRSLPRPWRIVDMPPRRSLYGPMHGMGGYVLGAQQMGGGDAALSQRPSSRRRRAAGSAATALAAAVPLCSLGVAAWHHEAVDLSAAARALHEALRGVAARALAAVACPAVMADAQVAAVHCVRGGLLFMAHTAHGGGGGGGTAESRGRQSSAVLASAAASLSHITRAAL